jgi:hypothetical protein
MAKLEILPLITPGEYKGKIVKEDGSKFELFKGDTIQFNGKTATVSYFKNGLHLIYEINGRTYPLTQDDLNNLVKVVGGRKSRRKSRKNKSRRYRRV